MGEKLDEPYLADVRQEWHWVKQGVEEILEEQKDLPFIAEDAVSYTHLTLPTICSV